MNDLTHFLLVFVSVTLFVWVGQRFRDSVHTAKLLESATDWRMAFWQVVQYRHMMGVWPGQELPPHYRVDWDTGEIIEEKP